MNCKNQIKLAEQFSGVGLPSKNFVVLQFEVGKRKIEEGLHYVKFSMHLLLIL